MLKTELTASMLKWLAISFMLIDHIGSIILTPLLGITPLVFITRAVGRLAFPLFCFLIVNGYRYTSSKKNYLLRLVLFAFLSEPFFNLALGSGSFFDASKQNVFFTLSLGLAAIWSYDYFKEKEGPMTLSGYLSVLAMAGATYLLKTDYDGYGVLLIVCMHLSYDNKKLMTGLVSLLTVTMYGANLLQTEYEPFLYAYLNLQLFAIGAMIFITQYKGKKGKVLHKYIFYLFYPIHLLILGLISMSL